MPTRPTPPPAPPCLTRASSTPLLGRAREALDSPVPLAGSLWYTRNETMGTLSFLLPLSSSPGAAPEGSAP
ncbi:MAG: hypothetical protein ACLR1T_17805 [Evtepia gabavorous]